MNLNECRRRCRAQNLLLAGKTPLKFWFQPKNGGNVNPDASLEGDLSTQKKEKKLQLKYATKHTCSVPLRRASRSENAKDVIALFYSTKYCTGVDYL